MITVNILVRDNNKEMYCYNNIEFIVGIKIEGICLNSRFPIVFINRIVGRWIRN